MKKNGFGSTGLFISIIFHIVLVTGFIYLTTSEKQQRIGEKSIEISLETIGSEVVNTTKKSVETKNKKKVKPAVAKKKKPKKDVKQPEKKPEVKREVKPPIVKEKQEEPKSDSVKKPVEKKPEEKKANIPKPKKDIKPPEKKKVETEKKSKPPVVKEKREEPKSDSVKKPVEKKPEEKKANTPKPKKDIKPPEKVEPQKTATARKKVISELKKKSVLENLKSGKGGKAKGKSGGGKKEGLENPGSKVSVNPMMLRLYYEKISDSIESSLKLPPSVKLDGYLTSQVSFWMNEKGSVYNVKIYSSSDSAVFDGYCIEAVNAASPLPPPPYELRKRIREEPFVVSCNNED